MRSPAQQEPGSARHREALAFAVFFVSGVAALLYQVIWQRMLALFAGSDAVSATLVVAAFMGGLGVGNLSGGHLADRLSRAACLFWFFVAESSIAAFALGSKWFFYDFLHGRVGAWDLGFPAMGAILFVSVVWPTFWMGLSLPLLARGLTSRIDRAAFTIGALYGWNTLGAAIGAFATTWLLLRRFDLETCLQIGAALNASCALAAIPLRAGLVHSETDVEAPAPAPSEGSAAPPRPPLFGVRGWLAVYLLSGAIALSLEIAWFRALGVMLKSTSFTFGTLLSIYLLGIAAGSLVGARIVQRGVRAPARIFLGCQTGVAVWSTLALAALIALIGADGLPAVFGYLGDSGQIPVARSLAVLSQSGISALLAPITDEQRAARGFVLLHGLLPLVLIGPATLLMGLSYPFLQRAVQTDAAWLGRRVGWLQTANIAGSLAGSLATGFVLLPTLGTPGVFRAIACVALVFPLLEILSRRRARERRVLAPLAGAASLVVAAFLLPSSKVFWTTLHGVDESQGLAAEDAASVSLVRSVEGRPQRLVMTGGLQVSSLPYGDYAGAHTLLGLIPALIHPDPKRAAVIGVGSGDTAYAAASRPETREVMAIEIAGSQIDLLGQIGDHPPFGDPGLAAFLADARIHRVVADGRTWLRHAHERFDVIEADALAPTSALSGNLYSFQYFALLRARLAPGGLAVSWVPTKRVADTLTSSFPYVLLLGNVGIGSETPIPFDPAAVMAAVRTPAVQAHFARAGLDVVALVDAFVTGTPPRVFGPDHDRSQLTDLNSDLFARDEFVVGGIRYLRQRVWAR